VTSDQEGKACLLGLQAAFETARVRQDPEVVFSVARALGLSFTDGIAWQKTYGAILSSGQELRLEYRSDEPSATLSPGPLVHQFTATLFDSNGNVEKTVHGTVAEPGTTSNNAS
jgi:hypothetical protein